MRPRPCPAGPAVSQGVGETVRHRRPRDCVAANSTSPGGFHSCQPVTNVAGALDGGVSVPWSWPRDLPPRLGVEPRLEVAVPAAPLIVGQLDGLAGPVRVALARPFVGRVDRLLHPGADLRHRQPLGVVGRGVGWCGVCCHTAHRSTWLALRHARPRSTSQDPLVVPLVRWYGCVFGEVVRRPSFPHGSFVSAPLWRSGGPVMRDRDRVSNPDAVTSVTWAHRRVRRRVG